MDSVEWKMLRGASVKSTTKRIGWLLFWFAARQYEDNASKQVKKNNRRTCTPPEKRQGESLLEKCAPGKTG